MAKLRVDKIAAPIIKDEFTGSVYFDGTGDYLQLDGSSDFAFGTGDFNIELWVYIVDSSHTNTLYDSRPSGSNGNQVALFYSSSSNAVLLANNGTVRITGTVDIGDSKWHHISLTRYSGVTKLYVNGVQDGSNYTDSTNYENPAERPFIGASGGSTNLASGTFTEGYISNLRICKGHAVYTGNFTVPTRELEVHLGAKGVVFPAADNRTVLLACQSSTDTTAEATGRHIITAAGNATAADANPGLFRKTNITSTTTENTGSVYFNGNASAYANNLTISSSGSMIGTGDFTVEFFIYSDSTADRRVFSLGANNADGSFVLMKDSDGIRVNWETSSSTGGSLNVVGSGWHHVAAVRSNNNLKIYIDGELDKDHGTVSVNFNASPLYIGDDPTVASQELTGYISNLRVVQLALYTSNFIPPTRELEVTPETTLLACYDGENIFAEKTGKIITAYGNRLSSPTPTATDNPIGITTNYPPVTRSVDPTAGPTFQGGAGFTSQNWLTLPKGTTAERFPDFGAVDAASARGLFGGGRTPSYLDTIDYITISTTGNAQDFGNLTQARGYMSSSSSRTRGVFNGGGTPGAVNTQDFITISSTGDAQNFGDLQTARYGAGNCSSSIRGVFGGGNPGPSNVIEFITIATAGNTQDFGDLTQARVYVGGCSSNTRGVFGGGTTPSDKVDTMDFIAISSTGNATDFGNLTQARTGVSGLSSRTRGVFSGGLSGNDPYTYHDIIDYITIATLGNAADFGDLIEGAYYTSSCSSSTRGVIGGAFVTPAYKNTIQYVTIASTGNAKDFGDLTATRGVASAVSNGHGGLG